MVEPVEKDSQLGGITLQQSLSNRAESLKPFVQSARVLTMVLPVRWIVVLYLAGKLAGTQLDNIPIDIVTRGFIRLDAVEQGTQRVVLA